MLLPSFTHLDFRKTHYDCRTLESRRHVIGRRERISGQRDRSGSYQFTFITTDGHQHDHSIRCENESFSHRGTGMADVRNRCRNFGTNHGKRSVLSLGSAGYKSYRS